MQQTDQDLRILISKMTSCDKFHLLIDLYHNFVLHVDPNIKVTHLIIIFKIKNYSEVFDER
jgi:hypothetical protein